MLNAFINLKVQYVFYRTHFLLKKITEFIEQIVQ